MATESFQRPTINGRWILGDPLTNVSEFAEPGTDLELIEQSLERWHYVKPTLAEQLFFRFNKLIDVCLTCYKWLRRQISLVRNDLELRARSTA